MVFLPYITINLPYASLYKSYHTMLYKDSPISPIKEAYYFEMIPEYLVEGLKTKKFWFCSCFTGHRYQYFWVLFSNSVRTKAGVYKGKLSVQYLIPSYEKTPLWERRESDMNFSSIVRSFVENIGFRCIRHLIPTIKLELNTFFKILSNKLEN